MGKSQSKRSVDITTETKKTSEEEVTGKMEKIEDIDQHNKQGNGDASPQEIADSSENKPENESENDKDLTTEKAAEASPVDPDNAADKDKEKDKESDKEKEKEKPAEAAAANDAGAATSPAADESLKKAKKDKVRKKWSFRNLSFGRKDKMKPSKSEEATEEIVANGDHPTNDVQQVPEETAAATADATTDEKQNAGEIVNGDDKPQASVAKSISDEITDVINSNLKTTESSVAEQTKTTAAEEITNGTASSKTTTPTEKKETDAIIEKITNDNAATITNSSKTAEINENGLASPKTDVAVDTPADVVIPSPAADNVAINKLIPNANEEHKAENGEVAAQENGTTEPEQIKSLIEVNTEISTKGVITSSSDPIVCNPIEEKIREIVEHKIETIIEKEEPISSFQSNVESAGTDAEIELKTEAEPEPQPELKPESHPEPEPKTETDTVVEPEPEAVLEQKTESVEQSPAPELEVASAESEPTAECIPAHHSEIPTDYDKDIEEPPMLPCTPPPSQICMFALQDPSESETQINYATLDTKSSAPTIEITESENLQQSDSGADPEEADLVEPEAAVEEDKTEEVTAMLDALILEHADTREKETVLALDTEAESVHVPVSASENDVEVTPASNDTAALGDNDATSYEDTNVCFDKEDENEKDLPPAPSDSAAELEANGTYAEHRAPTLEEIEAEIKSECLSLEKKTNTSTITVAIASADGDCNVNKETDVILKDIAKEDNLPEIKTQEVVPVACE